MVCTFSKIENETKKSSSLGFGCKIIGDLMVETYLGKFVRKHLLHSGHLKDVAAVDFNLLELLESTCLLEVLCLKRARRNSCLRIVYSETPNKPCNDLKNI